MTTPKRKAAPRADRAQKAQAAPPKAFVPVEPPPSVASTFATPEGFAPRSNQAPPALSLPDGVNMRDAIYNLSELADVACAARNMPHVMDLARAAVAAHGAATQRANPNLQPVKVPLQAVADMLRVGQIGFGRGDAYHATRGLKVARGMEAVPAVINGRMVQLTDAGELIEVTDPREATSALDVFRYYHERFNFDQLRVLERSKTCPKDSIRDPAMLNVRRTIPDFGALLVLAMLESCGFEKGGRRLPLVDMLNTNFILLTWAENVIGDLRGVLAEGAEIVKGEIYSPFVDYYDPSVYVKYTPELYLQLVEEMAPAHAPSGASSDARRRASEAYARNQTRHDALSAEWRRLMREVDSLQETALVHCDALLALIRFKKKEKDWRRSTETPEERALVRARGPRGASDMPPRPEVSRQRKQPRGSTVTPGEAARLAYDSGQRFGEETGIGVPRFNAESLGLSEVERKKALAAGGMDGPRTCEQVYPGVIWEAIMGPMYHGMDPDCTEVDCQMVVIAPRRVNGPGLNILEARPMLVSEYEAYFSPLEE